MSLLAFARSLLARWDRRVVSPRPLGLVFRQPHRFRPLRSRQAGITHTHLRRDLHVDLRPNIALAVVRPTAEAARSRLHEVVSSSSMVGRTNEVAHELVLRNTSMLAAGRILERALSRSRRVEVLTRPGPAGRLAAPADRATVPPPLVVHRAAQERVPSAEPRHDPRGAGQTAPGGPVSADVDLVRVTDHVVSAIDARLIAHAERLGRG